MLSIVNRSDNFEFQWNEPSSISLMLPTAPSGYTVVPALSSRLQVNSTGHLVSTGQLQASDAGTYMITSSDFNGVFVLMIRVSGQCGLACLFLFGFL